MPGKSAHPRPGLIITLIIILAALSAGYLYFSHYRHVRQARRILYTAGTEHGLIVHLGNVKGKLLSALYADTGFRVHGLFIDRETMQEVRDYIRKKDMGDEVTVKYLEGMHLPYPDDRVDLLVATGPVDFPVEEMMRVLNPGGVALLKKKEGWEKRTGSPMPVPGEGSFFEAEVKESGDSVKAARMNRVASTVLRPVYPYLAKFIADTFELGEKKGTGIDIGGGSGDLVFELCRHTPGIYWVNADINPYFLPYVCRKARKMSCMSQVGSIQADAMDLPFRENYADVVVSRDCFQSWPDLKKGFAEIVRVLKPGGKAFIGRGFPPNMPPDTYRSIMESQGREIASSYRLQHYTGPFQQIMEELDVIKYKILVPYEDSESRYGIWIVFTK